MTAEPVIHVRGDEARQPYLLLHGTPGSHRDWDGVAERAGSHHLVLVDLPDHGEAAAGAIGNAEMLDAAEQMLRGLGRPAVVVGHSYGGWIAAHLSARAPASVARLVLVGPLDRIEPDGIALRHDLIAQLSDGRLTVQDAPALAADLLFGEEADEATRARWMDRVRSLDAPAWTRLLRRTAGIAEEGLVAPRPSVPTVVVHGEREQSVPIDVARRLLPPPPDGRLDLVDTDSHMLALTHPERVAAAIFGEGP